MDFLMCCFQNLSFSDYNGPIKMKVDNNKEIILTFQEKEILGITQSYNFLSRFGSDAAKTVLTNYISLSVFQHSNSNLKERWAVLNNHYAEMQVLSNAFWFLKDNSVTPYFATISSDTKIEPMQLRRNVFYTNSQASDGEIVKFTKNEIEEVARWFTILEPLLAKMPIEKMEFQNGLQNMSNYVSFEIPSFQRAYYFLDIARKTDFLPSKIASYISILETLFAVSGDNTHKVAERTAVLIGNNDADRIKIFNNITKAYKDRSSYVHGSEIANKKHKTLPETSKELDSLVRRVLVEMYLNYPKLNYMNSSKKNPEFNSVKAVDEWFIEEILKKR